MNFHPRNVIANAAAGISAVALCLAGCGHAGDAISNGGFTPATVTPASDVSNALASPTFNSPSGVRRHVLTADYFADANPPAFAYSTMAPWLNWAVVTGLQSYGAKAAGIRTMLYTNPNRQAPGGPMYTSDETTFAHDCLGNRITFPQHPGDYLMDPHSANLQSLWKQAVNGVHGDFDAIFEDTAVTVQGVAAALPCNFTQADWSAATNALDASLGLAVVENANLGKTGGVDTVSLGLALNPSTIGGMTEGCYSSANITNPKPRGATWQAIENTEIQFALAHKRFMCRGLSVSPGATAQDERIYMVASFLLTYHPSHSILSEKFNTASHFNEEPESELVPIQPVVSLPADISGLMVSANVYGRQYSACYVAGNLVGPCAVVINIDGPSQAHPFPWPSAYQHTLVLTGAGILDGGVISTTGPPPPANIPGNDAVIVFQ